MAYASQEQIMNCEPKNGIPPSIRLSVTLKVYHSNQVWKDVDGVLTCDLSIHSRAEPVAYLTFEEAAGLAYFGAQEDRHLYPDMPAYHSLTVTLGQAGLLKELLKIIEDMKQKPVKRVKNMRYKNWDPTLQPDMVVFNGVLNACVARRQWKAVSWVFEQLRKNGLRPNGATYGLAMELNLISLMTVKQEKLNSKETS